MDSIRLPTKPDLPDHHDGLPGQPVGNHASDFHCTALLSPIEAVFRFAKDRRCGKCRMNKSRLRLSACGTETQRKLRGFESAAHGTVKLPPSLPEADRLSGLFLLKNKEKLLTVVP